MVDLEPARKHSQKYRRSISESLHLKGIEIFRHGFPTYHDDGDDAVQNDGDRVTVKHGPGPQKSVSAVPSLGRSLKGPGFWCPCRVAGGLCGLGSRR